MAIQVSVERLDDEQKPKVAPLTYEELKVLRDCRWNAMFYRGFPAGVVSFLMARQVVSRGYFRRFSGLFYSGAVAVAFFGGVASYSKTCAEKIMSLENSSLADAIRASQKKMGFHTERARYPAEFSDEVSELNTSTNQPVVDEFESPLNKRLETSRWDEIRKESRLAQSPHPSEKGGVSYDELRRRNRSNQGQYKSLTPEEEAELENEKKQSNSREKANFNATSFYNDKTSALDFSKSADSKSSSFNRIHDNGFDDDERARKPYREGIPSKNKYGDEIL